MASIRDYAITINATATASMVCEMPTHETGDLLVAFVNKDSASAFTTPANWDLHRAQTSAGSGGGVYAKRAASGSETVTFALTIETCCAVVLAIKDVEAAIDSGAGALTINVVAAGGTFTRTTGSFDTDGFTAGQSVVMSGFTNAGNNGVKIITSITGSGTIMTVTSEAALVNESGNNNERVISTGFDVSAKSGADDSTLPLTGVGATTIVDNCLILHGLSTDTGMGASAYPGWVNLFVGDAGANSLCVAYTYKKTAGAVSAPDHWSGAADDSRGFIIAVRDSGSEDSAPLYIAPGTTPSVLISPLTFSTTPDKGTWELTTNDITSIAGKTVGQVDGVAAADSGYNPFRAALRMVAASSTANLTASEMRFTSAPDFTAQAGVLFGTYRFQVPRDYIDCSKPSNGGIFVMFADAENDYKAWTVAAQFSKTTDPSNRQNYAIQVEGSSDTSYATSGTIAWNAINDLYLGGAGYYGACAVEFSDLYLLNETVLLGGTATTPIGFASIIDTVNRGSGFIPLIIQSGSAAQCWTRLRFGGADATHIAVSLSTFQYPRKADEVDYLDFHVDNNHMGIEFYGLADDTLSFTNCVFTSDSSYYWRFNSSHDADANIDFSNSTVVNANVTLRSTVSLSNTSFTNCSTFTFNSANVSECNFSNTKISCSGPADLANINNCSFTSSGTGHAIEVSGSAGNVSFMGNTFSAYASVDGSTGNEAIYVNIGSGTMTITITGGGSVPSIRTAGATVTVVAGAVDVAVHVQTIAGADLQNARVFLKAADGSGPFPFEDVVTIVNSGTTATVTHTAHAMLTSDQVVISGASHNANNGVFSITKINDNSYSYTMGSSPGSNPTGTILATFVALHGLTDVDGNITTTRVYSSDQPITGWSRFGSSPYYKPAAISGTVDSGTGFSTTALMIDDA